MVRVGLHGFPNSGKTTLFNALTGLEAPAAPHPYTTAAPNPGVLAVSDPLLEQAAELGVADVHQDPNAHKMPTMKRLLAAKQVEWSEVAVVGDDLADLPLMRKAGLAATVANGVPEVCRVATWQSARRGGHGAVREFAEALLRARGQWEELVDEYCRERGG